MGELVAFRRKGHLSDPDAARRWVQGLRGPSYAYAFALFLALQGRGPTPARPRSVSVSRSARIRQAVTVGLSTWTRRANPRIRMARAVFLGVQERPGGRPPVELWNLTAGIPGHPRGSTVSRETIEAAGYTLPSKADATASSGAGVCPKGHPMQHSSTGGTWCPACDLTSARARYGRRNPRRMCVGLYPPGTPGLVWSDQSGVASCRTDYHGPHTFESAPRRNLPSWVDSEGGGFDDPEGASQQESEPEEGDYLITGARGGGEAVSVAGGRYLATFPSVGAALQFIADRMQAEQFWPNVWTVSDHGNANLITMDLPKPTTRGGRRGGGPSAADRRRNPLPPCSYCGGPGGFVAGPDHSAGCLFYRKPRRVVRTIGRRRPRGNPGGWLYVNGVQYEIVAKDHDRQGELLMIRKPRGRKLWVARRHAPGDSRGCIVFTMPGRGAASNPPQVPSNATLIYPKGRFDPGTTWRGTHRSGGRYYHKFRSDTDKAMYGLPGGGIAFIPKRGRLWGYR